MKELLILGAGGHASVVIDAAQQLGFSVTGLIGNVNETGFDLPLLGDDNALLQHTEWIEEYDIHIAIGDNVARQRWAKMLAEKGANFATIIHPKAALSPHATIGAGCYVGPFAAVNAHARIGTHCIINTHTIIEHHNTIENYCHIAPNAALAGNVTCGECSFIGMGSSVTPGCNIASNSFIKAHSLIKTNV